MFCFLNYIFLQNMKVKKPLQNLDFVTVNKLDFINQGKIKVDLLTLPLKIKIHI